MKIEKSEVLTRKNFWNGMKEKYPKSVDHFLDWWDKYRVVNAWEGPKLSRLPIGMQMGIFMEYAYSIGTDLAEKSKQELGDFSIITYTREVMEEGLTHFEKNFENLPKID